VAAEPGGEAPHVQRLAAEDHPAQSQVPALRLPFRLSLYFGELAER
jgi:hypothetical protein